MRIISKATFVLISSLAVSILLPALARACDPSAAESMVRQRVQNDLAQWPNLYQDILQGRFAPTVPGRYGSSTIGGGQSNNLPAGYVPNQAQYGQINQPVYQQIG